MCIFILLSCCIRNKNIVNHISSSAGVHHFNAAQSQTCCDIYHLKIHFSDFEIANNRDCLCQTSGVGTILMCTNLVV